MSTNTQWFSYIEIYLASGKLPPNMSAREKRMIIQLSANYSLTDGDLFRTCLDLIIRICVREDEMHNILKSCHYGPCGGELSTKF